MSAFQNVLAKARTKFQPLFVSFEIDQLCNFSCLHCYNFDRSVQKKNLSNDQLSKTEVLNIIADLSKNGCLVLSFTGGEPTLHPHLEDFIRQTKKHHMIAKIKTNASTLNEALLTKLLKAGLDELDVSLYGMSEEIYKKFTGKAMASLVRDNILRCKKYSLRPKVNIILHHHNVDELDLMLDFVYKNDLDFSISIEMTARYDNTDSSKLTAISIEQFEQLCRGPHKDYFLTQNPEGELRCSCAKTVCGINFQGKVYPCIGAPVESGDLRKNDFGTIWNESVEFKKIRKLEVHDFEKCFSCDIKKQCQRSSGSALINHGDYTAADLATCEITKVRSRINSN